MSDDKPFVCPLTTCSMKFVNEDHLTVHKAKHELSLTLTPSAYKLSFYDQTPTPTRFLNALESELFQDLQSDNPFDVTFRRANSLVASGTHVSLPEPTNLISSLQDTEPLNTPSITLTAEQESSPPISSSVTSVITLKHPVPKIELNNKPLDESDSPALLSSSFTFSSALKETSLSAVSTSNSSHLSQDDDGSPDISSTCESVNSDASVTPTNPVHANTTFTRNSVVQTPVITSVGNLAKSNATCVPTAVVVPRPSSDTTVVSSSINHVSANSPSHVNVNEGTQPPLQPINIASMLQLIVRLPNGQTMPVPYVAVPASTTTKTAVKAPITQSKAKMRLKEVLKKGKNNHVTSSVKRLKNCTLPSPQSSQDGFSESPPSSPVSRPGATGRKRRETIDNPEEKRQKSLERNRAAATRCRQKRKQWIQALEVKADELAVTNASLQNEVSILRAEVAQLKTLLLAHKDCPVTQQMKASGMCESSEAVKVTRVSAINGIVLEPETILSASDVLEVEMEGTPNQDESIS